MKNNQVEEQDGGGSSVGLRCSWICAICGEHATTYQLVRLGVEFVSLRLPPGWKFEHAASICAQHSPREIECANATAPRE